MQSGVGVEFTCAQVYSEWVRINQNSWRHDNDQVKSGKIYLKERNWKEVEVIPI
jgi:hypothetical protein